jgi:hypothetical protein
MDESETIARAREDLRAELTKVNAKQQLRSLLVQ